MLGKGIAVLGMWGFLGFCVYLASQSHNPGANAPGYILIAFGALFGIFVTFELVAKNN